METWTLTISTALALTENSGITHLSLGECGIDDDGVDQFFTYLKSANLQYLNLSGNQQIGSNGVTNLGKLKYNGDYSKDILEGKK